MPAEDERSELIILPKWTRKSLAKTQARAYDQDTWRESLSGAWQNSNPMTIPAYGTVDRLTWSLITYIIGNFRAICLCRCSYL